MRRYEKHYNGIQIDDSSSHALLCNYLDIRSHPAELFPCELPLQLITTRTKFHMQPLDLILLQQQYHLSRLRFTSQSAMTTLLKEYTLRQRNRDLCSIPWPSHRRQCDEIYDRPGSYQNPEFSGND